MKKRWSAVTLHLHKLILVCTSFGCGENKKLRKGNNMTGKCGADCTNRCSIGACPKAEPKDEFDGFITDFDEDAVTKRNAEREQAQTESACKLSDDGDCAGCKI